mmetsp:Transcript_12844/g.23284  ORF Transcript_12844/g.23284 Transcript_12844/m.23284 type:complete len:85 (+) Transcript_12844:292-546(+)
MYFLRMESTGVSGLRKCCSSRTSIAELMRVDDILTVGLLGLIVGIMDLSSDVDAKFNAKNEGEWSRPSFNVVDSADDAWMMNNK